MDISQENTNSTMPRVGAFGWLATIVGGAAAGVGALITTVNHQMASMLRKHAAKGFESLDRMGQDIPELMESGATISSLRSDAGRLFNSGFAAGIENDALRGAVGDSKSVIGKALADARKAGPHIHPLTNSVIAHQYAEGGIDVAQQVAELVVNDEKLMAAAAVENAASRVPLMKRLTLSKDLHLTGGQKSLAALAFAGAAVAVGAIIYGAAKSHARHQQMS